MANSARGYCDVKIGEDVFEVSLNMGALAEIEAEFGVESFEDALNFGDKVSATKLRKFMRGLLKGNGVTIDADMSKKIDKFTPAEFMELVSRVLAASGLTAGAGEASEGGDAPLEVATAGEPG